MANFSAALGADGLIQPNVQKVPDASAYLDLRTSGWAKQYLPELYEAEVEKYGDRSISGFLGMVGAEMPMASDQVVWSEQGRLHLAYKATINTNSGAVTADSIRDIDDETTAVAHAVRKGQMVVCMIETGSDKVVAKAQCTIGSEVATNALTLKPYGAANFVNLTGIAGATTAVIRFFVYGSDFGKGENGMDKAVEPVFKSFSNKPIILKDKYIVSGSDASQIGWVEVSGEAGQSGYLWYLKAEGDTRKRFEDYLEMSMVEAIKKVSGSTVTGTGTEGLFQAIVNRGMVGSNLFDTTSEVMGDFDLMLQELDKQGGVQENMMFLNRGSALKIDDALGALNAYHGSGSNYGVFNNSEDMALNLGFNGFRRASYDFYKTDWKYLNNKSTRFIVNNTATAGQVNGVLVPAGTTSVYDENMGRNIRRPFLHVRYRASQADDRKLKSWITGSVGATTSDLDAMEVHYLSERCLVTQAANNFVLFR